MKKNTHTENRDFGSGTSSGNDIPGLLTSLTHLESLNNTFMSIFTFKLKQHAGIT
jgi:hypothetical protein